MKDWCLEVWGEYACFTRPEMKVERVSYEVITPSAARAIFEAILWKPAIKWNITRVEVLNPIKWVSVRRNEVGKRVTSPTASMLKGGTAEPSGLYIEDERQQRAGLFLKDVRYRLYAYFDFIPPAQRKANKAITPEYWADNAEETDFSRQDENASKYAAMFGRRARKGQCFHRPYFGCREFAAAFRLVEDQENKPEPLNESRELGWMLYDMNFENPENVRPLFFKGRMENGVIDTDHRNVEVRG